MQFSIGDKVIINEDMTKIIRERYNQSYENIDYQERENMWGRADFSGRISIVRDIKEVTVRINRLDVRKVKYRLSCSTSQLFSEEFLELEKKPILLDFGFVEIEKDKFVLTDIEGDKLELLKAEIKELIDRKLEEGLYNNGLLEVSHYGNLKYISDGEYMIGVKLLDLKKVK